MSGNGPKAAPAKHGAPSWLVQAGIDGGWLGTDGNPKPAAPKKATPAKGNATDNSKQYRASQDLTELSAGFGGLNLSSSPSIDRKGSGIPLTGIGTIGNGTGGVAPRPFKVAGYHKTQAPTLHYEPGVDRAGSNPSRAAGPKPKATPTYHKPDVTLKPAGVVGTYPYGGTRTYKLDGNS